MEEEEEVGHTGLVAVAIRIVAAEQGIALVSVDHPLIVPDRFTRGSNAKVFAVVFGAVAVAKDMLFGMFGQGEGVVKTLAELGDLGGIAGWMDDKVGCGPLVPVGCCVMGLVIRMLAWLDGCRQSEGTAGGEGNEDGDGAAHVGGKDGWLSKMDMIEDGINAGTAAFYVQEQQTASWLRR